MVENFSYGRALAEAESTNRASTRDARPVGQMSVEELDAEHARVNNATRAQQIRDELNKRRSAK